jgi:hypothetical protein
LESAIQKTIRSSEANLIGNVDAVDEGQRGDQFIQTLKSIWTSSDNNGDVVEFRGKYFTIYLNHQF